MAGALWPYRRTRNGDAVRLLTRSVATVVGGRHARRVIFEPSSRRGSERAAHRTVGLPSIVASETGTGLDDLGCTTWVGAHPFDGRAVACWVTHPNHPEHADQAHLFAAAIQAPELRPDELIRELDPGVVTMRIDAEQGYATLTLWGQPVA